MSSRDWRLRVQDILNAIVSIQKSTVNMTFEEFLAEEIIVKAVLYDFIVIGEAARNIPTQVASSLSANSLAADERYAECDDS